MSRLTRAIRFTRHWHARLGAIAAVFFLFLASTGVALNHTDTLALAKRQVDTGWLMRWYGLKAEVPTQGYLLETGYVAGDGQRWIMDGKVISFPPERVIGAVEVGEGRYLATTSSLHIYQAGGDLVDKLSGSALPAGAISQIGKTGAKLLIKTPNGIFASEDGLTWQPYPSEPESWSRPQPLPDDIKAKTEAFLAPGLPLERVLLDIHSGRIFGRYGPLAMDLAALALMVLSLSGLWIYLRSIRKRH